MNLAVHGLEGGIRHGGEVNSYYGDPHKAVGAVDFALANPPFNVNAVDKDRLKDPVGPGRRFPFGLPRTDNTNYLWIQLFYSSLNMQCPIRTVKRVRESSGSIPSRHQRISVPLSNLKALCPLAWNP